MIDGDGTARTRWMGVGRSGEADPFAAGVTAASRALEAQDAQLVIVFASFAYELEAVLAGVHSVCGDVPLIGCSSHGEIGRGGPRDGSVVVTALGGPGFAVATAVATDVAGRQREAGAQVAGCVSEIPERPYQVLLMFTDGLVSDQEEFLRGAYAVVGASVPLFGGAAADGWAMQRTYQFYGQEVMSGAVVGAVIGSDAPIGIGVGHGWRKVGEPMMVTSSADGQVHTLDDRPALDVYIERFAGSSDLSADGVALSAFALSRPIGIERRGGPEVRNISTGIDAATRSFRPGGDIREGGLVWAMQGHQDSILVAVKQACEDALDPLGADKPLGLLTLSCAALRAVIGDEGIAREGELLAAHAGQAPFAGFYTYGEIARTRGVDGFHNQTLVVLAFG